MLPSIKAVMTGGNHLASQLLRECDPAQYRRADYDTVLHERGQPYADIWVAWKAIMDLRDIQEAMVKTFDDKYTQDVMALCIFLKKLMDAGHSDVKYLAVVPKGRIFALADKLNPDEEKQMLDFVDHLRSEAGLEKKNG